MFWFASRKPASTDHVTGELCSFLSGFKGSAEGKEEVAPEVSGATAGDGRVRRRLLSSTPSVSLPSGSGGSRSGAVDRYTVR